MEVLMRIFWVFIIIVQASGIFNIVKNTSLRKLNRIEIFMVLVHIIIIFLALYFIKS